MITDHTFRVPLDYSGTTPGTINVFCRELVAPVNARRQQPYLLYLQGGCGVVWGGGRGRGPGCTAVVGSMPQLQAGVHYQAATFVQGKCQSCATVLRQQTSSTLCLQQATADVCVPHMRPPLQVAPALSRPAPLRRQAGSSVRWAASVLC